MFNAIIFGNLGNDYGEIVSTCSIYSNATTFPEQLDILTSHEAPLQMQNLVAEITPIVALRYMIFGQTMNAQMEFVLVCVSWLVSAKQMHSTSSCGCIGIVDRSCHLL